MRLFNRIYCLLPLILVIAGVLGVIVNYRDYQAGKVLTMETEGILSDTKIKKRVDSDGNRSYHTKATVTYQVRGESYSPNVKLDGKHYDGDTIRIHYNPDEPESYSVKSQGDKRWSIAMSALLILAGIVLTVVLWFEVIGG